MAPCVIGILQQGKYLKRLDKNTQSTESCRAVIFIMINIVSFSYSMFSGRTFQLTHTEVYPPDCRTKVDHSLVNLLINIYSVTLHWPIFCLYTCISVAILQLLVETN